VRHLTTADLHLNERKRFTDYLENLDNITKIALKEKPDVYDILGDIFDKRNPTPLELKAFAIHLNTMKKIVKHINLIIGNHCKLREDLSTIDWVIDDKITVVKKLIFEEGGRKIYFAHQTFLEAKLGPKEIHLDAMSWKQLKGYDVIMVGHIHKPQILNKINPLVLIPGSIEKVNFGERGEEKCVWIWNTKTLKLKKHVLSTRPMYYVVLNLDTKETFINDKPYVEGSAWIKESILKIKVLGKQALIDKLNYDEFVKKFEGCYSVKLQFEYTTEIKEYEKQDDEVQNDVDIVKQYMLEQQINSKVQKIVERIMSR